MAFVPGYKYDIFVSYAHVDDDLLPGAEKGWVTTLVETLTTKLGQRLGRTYAYTLWKDELLKKREKITGQILDALQQSATIVVIFSPAYVASEWCVRELNSFLEFIKHRWEGRILLVQRYFVEDSEKPPEFYDLKGFQFWERESEGKRIRVFGDPRPNPDDVKYYQAVDDLTNELVDELHELKKAAEQFPGGEHGAAPAAAPQKPAVFLAEVTDDLESVRDGVRRFLEQAGMCVLPSSWYNSEPRIFAESVKRDVARSDLFVQLLSSLPGKRPPGLPEGYLRLQFECAKAAGKPVLQWRSPALDIAAIEDPDQRAFLEAETVRAEGVEDFKSEIKRAVFAKPVPPPQQNASVFVFVDRESVDRELADKVCSTLLSAGIGYSLPASIEDPGSARLDLEDNLLTCTALVIVYGTTTATWVRHQFFQCQKVLARRETPLKALAVFEGPPEEKQSLDFGIPNLSILNFRRGVDEARLTDFVRSLRQGGPS